MASPDYPVRTSRLSIRPFADRDLKDVIAIYSRPDVLRYLYVGERPETEIAKSLDERRLKTSLDKEGDKLILAVELTEDGPQRGRCIGEVVLVWLSETHRSAEAGFIIHFDFHGKGYAAETITPLLRFGFETMGFHRIIGRCDGRNAASARLMGKLGMRQEAHLIENEFVKGEWTDELVFALLDREWRAREG